MSAGTIRRYWLRRVVGLCAWSLIVIVSVEGSALPSDRTNLVTQARHYRQYNDMHGFEQALSSLHAAPTESEVTTLLGFGCALDAEELGCIRAAKDQRDIFPKGVQDDDRFVGYVVEEYPHESIRVLQFRDGRLVSGPNESHISITRPSRLKIDGNPWCLLGEYDPGLSLESSWHILLDRAGNGILRRGKRSFPVGIRPRDFVVVTNGVRLFSTLSGGRGYGPRVVDGKRRQLKWRLFGEGGKLVVRGDIPDGSEAGIAVFDSVWEILEKCERQTSSVGASEGAGTLLEERGGRAPGEVQH